jgi:tRNA U34 2-thiouridine synthase MnmA/TrmU
VNKNIGHKKIHQTLTADKVSLIHDSGAKYLGAHRGVRYYTVDGIVLPEREVLSGRRRHYKLLYNVKVDV